mgnify:CR=1 FL=1|tara:strand:- start:176 stop:646 length:471 start_codon:yes stop_codon:yes gene_type:complete
MDKTADRINRQTLDFSNKIYEELSTIVCQREDLRYFNYDLNDEKIDHKLERMFELLDDIYNSCIEKKTGWKSRKPPSKPKKILFPEEELPNIDVHTPSPRKPVKTPNTPVKKKSKNNIKVEVTDDDNVLNTILYSSDEESDLELTDESENDFEQIY